MDDLLRVDVLKRARDLNEPVADFLLGKLAAVILRAFDVVGQVPNFERSSTHATYLHSIPL
jgi:hypothetical protein